MTRQPPGVLKKIDGGYMHFCPGCLSHHIIATDEPLDNGARWQFDGNLDKPTFSPSIRIRWETAPGLEKHCCHYFIRTGMIEFCSDSTHRLAGQTVTMHPIDL